MGLEEVQDIQAKAIEEVENEVDIRKKLYLFNIIEEEWKLDNENFDWTLFRILDTCTGNDVFSNIRNKLNSSESKIYQDAFVRFKNIVISIQNFCYYTSKYHSRLATILGKFMTRTKYVFISNAFPIHNYDNRFKIEKWNEEQIMRLRNSEERIDSEDDKPKAKSEEKIDSEDDKPKAKPDEIYDIKDDSNRSLLDCLAMEESMATDMAKNEALGKKQK